MNDDISSLSALTQDIINQRTSMISMDIDRGMRDSVDASRYYIPPNPFSYQERGVTTVSDRVDSSAIRQPSIAKSDIDKIYFDMAEIRAYASRVENRSDSRINLLSTDVDVLKSLITTLQSMVSQQSDAMKILASEIDELKSGQLEPLEDME